MPDKAMSLNLVIGASLAGGFHGVFRTAKGALGDLSKTAANLQIGDKLKSLRAEQRKQAATAKVTRGLSELLELDGGELMAWRGELQAAVSYRGRL